MFSGKMPELSFDMNDFMMDIRMGFGEEVKDKVKSFFLNYRNSNSKTGMDLVNIFVSLVNAALASTLSATGIPMSKVFKECSNPFSEAYKFCTINEIEVWLLNNIDKVMPFTHERRECKTNLIVQQAKKIIEENSNVNLSIEFLSKMLFLNKDYLGRIFKLSTGFSVNEYINRIKITKAKDMLKDGKLKVYEIAELVGFLDEHYFSTVFKKITGKTPSDYK